MGAGGQCALACHAWETVLVLVASGEIVMLRSMVIVNRSVKGLWKFLAVAAVLAIAIVPPSTLGAREAPTTSDRVVRGYLWDSPMLEELRQWADVWAVLKDGSVVVKVDAVGERRMRRAGFYLEIDQRWTDQVRNPAQLTEGQNFGIPGFACYRTVEETMASATGLVATYPTLATYTDVGDSYLKTQNVNDGYDLKVLRLTNSAIGGGKPKILILGSVHAREYTTAELVTRFAEHLLSNYGTDPDATWLLDFHEVHILLVANPDGRKKAETGLLWRKNLRPNGCATANNMGTDLNRGYDFQWGCCGGSSTNPCSQAYRGTAPAVEPENQAIQNYLLAIFPDQRGPGLATPADPNTTGLLFDVHSFSQVLLSTWGFSTTTPPPDDSGIQTLGRKYGWFVDYPSQTGSFGVVDGSSKDYAYGELGIPAYTIELGTEFFQQCDVFEHLMVDDHIAAMTWAAKIVRTSYITPSGPDVTQLGIPASTFLAGAAVPLSAEIDDTRFQNDNGVEPTQNIQAAQYSVDLPPWDGLASPPALFADDGLFNAKVETVNAMIDTTGLVAGRHTVYVRGQDAAGNWGAVSALFLDIAASATSTIAGIAVDAITTAPVEVTIRAGRSETTSDPVTGAYSLLVPTGTYEVVAVGPAHAPTRQMGVVVAAGGVGGINFQLPPYTEVLFEDAESGVGGWTAQAPWAITLEAALSGTRSWTDSPGGNYLSNRDRSLTSPSMDLSGLEGTRLSFHHLYDLESGFDIGWVEVSANGGGWQRVDGFARTGFDSEWLEVEVDLALLDGVADARVRFRLLTDGGTVADGWHLDDIRVRAHPEGIAAEIFSDGFESGGVGAWTLSVP